MDWLEIIRQIDQKDIVHLLNDYEALGPLPGIVAPLLESFFPFLPLLVILVANAAAYGLWQGFFYSWIGVSAGSVFVFLLVRTFGKKFSSWMQIKYPKTQKFLHWVENKGFTPVFVMACLPFAPSFLVNVVSGLSRISLRVFLLAILLGKGFMVFWVSWAGHDLFALLQNPWKIVLISVIFFLMWLVGKKIEQRYV